MNCIILGFGIVGKNLYKELADLDPDFFDKYKPFNRKIHSQYDIGFICVDTPLKDGVLDFTEVENAIKENDCEVYCIKSTVPVGTTEQLREKLGKRIIFSPEYYGNTVHSQGTFNFTILGGDKKDCDFVYQAILPCYTGDHVFRFVDSNTAELVKFMENSFIATKVSFCSSFYSTAKQFGVEYDELRELFVLDPRVNPSHTFVYKDHPYWQSHCLDKDVAEISNFNNFMRNVRKYNETAKNETEVKL